MSSGISSIPFSPSPAMAVMAMANAAMDAMARGRLRLMPRPVMAMANAATDALARGRRRLMLSPAMADAAADTMARGRRWGYQCPNDNNHVFVSVLFKIYIHGTVIHKSKYKVI